MISIPSSNNPLAILPREILLEQATAQFELLTGRKAPKAYMSPEVPRNFQGKEEQYDESSITARLSGSRKIRRRSLSPYWNKQIISYAITNALSEQSKYRPNRDFPLSALAMRSSGMNVYSGIVPPHQTPAFTTRSGSRRAGSAGEGCSTPAVYQSNHRLNHEGRVGAEILLAIQGLGCI